MTDLERLEIFAKSLGLSVRELEKVAIRYGFGSRSTFLRIHRDDASDAVPQRGKPTLAGLAELVSPEFLARLPASDRFLEPELASRLLGVGNTAWFGWERFLGGNTDFPPKMRSLEEGAALVRNLTMPERAMELQELLALIDSTEREALQLGAVRRGRLPDELLRCEWSKAKSSAEMWLRLRVAICLTQIRLEDTAAVVYLAAPVLPLVLLPRRVWQRQLGANFHADAAAELRNECDRRSSQSRRPSKTDGTQRLGTAAAAAATLLRAYSRRHWGFQTGVGLRQAVVALFSEERTRAFFEELTIKQRLDCAKNLEALERRGLVLLASPMTAQEEQELPASVTVGGDTPGCTMADEVIVKGAVERDAWAALAEADAYQQSRACIERLANHSKTKRIRAADVNALVLPASVVTAIAQRAQRKFEFDPWHYLDL